ncbi:MAG: hypothetical protein WAT79_11895 [Saprospiraceae bacterium]
MKTLTFSLLALTIFFFGCGQTSNQNTIEQPAAVSHEDHQANDENALIELVNGEKWMVNAEMKPYILDAENILAQYANSNYKELAEQLKDKNKGLIKSCTMDGQSHDELHKWLHPHMELIEALADAENGQEANKVIIELKKSFANYHTYFQ